MALTCEQIIGKFAVELEKWQISGVIEWKDKWAVEWSMREEGDFIFN